MKEINSTTDLIELYPDRFDGIGKFPGKHQIPISETAKPVIHAARKFPI